MRANFLNETKNSVKQIARVEESRDESPVIVEPDDWDGEKMIKKRSALFAVRFEYLQIMRYTFTDRQLMIC